MKFSSVYSAAVIGLASATPTPGVASNTPPSSGVTINSISYGGSGCPQGTVGSFISSDHTTYTLIFDSFVASIGGGASTTDSRKNCQINVDLHYPSGYQFSVYTQNYRGYVQLDNGITAVQKANYYFSGSSAQASTQSSFTGPVDKDYLITDTIPFDSVVWSPCGTDGALNINAQVRLDNSKNRNGQGQMTTDSTDGKVEYKLGFQWQRC
jgi:hypothetical protein